MRVAMIRPMSNSTQNLVLTLVFAVAVIATAFCVSLACTAGIVNRCSDGEWVLTQGVVSIGAAIAAVFVAMPVPGSALLMPRVLRLDVPRTSSPALAPMRI